MQQWYFITTYIFTLPYFFCNLQYRFNSIFFLTIPLNFSLLIDIVALSDVGLFRSKNEDAYNIGINAFKTAFEGNEFVGEVSSIGNVLAVADGMGGLEAGEIAAQTALNSIRKQFEQQDILPENEEEINIFLKNSVYHAHEEIVDLIITNKKLKGMGTTVIVAWLLGKMMHLAWCGDSRCYIAYPNGKSELLTDDHSKVWEMVKLGILTPEQARLHPQSHVLTYALGDKDYPPQIATKSIALHVGDRILLCSDGLNAMLSDEQISFILSNRENTLKETASLLVKSANDAGGYDNVTVILAEIKK